MRFGGCVAIICVALMLSSCALSPAQPTVTATLAHKVSTPPPPSVTLTPFQAATPTAPSRSTPIVTETLAIFPSVTVFPSATPLPRKYVFPVQPAAVAQYSEGVTSHGYPAIDIFAPAGTEFVAVTRGTIEFVNYEDRWQPENDHPAFRSGLAVSLLGEDGWRYYGSHLSAIAEGIAPGVVVQAGQVLGYVGNSGNARNTPPHLHFGISRPTYAGDWVTRRGEIDPFPYLNGWLAGVDLTPQWP